MKEYFANTNGKHILMCKDTDETVIFNEFGEMISKCSYREGLAQCGTGYVQEVKLCSISGKSTSDLEVYFNGVRKKVSGIHSMIFNNIRNSCLSNLAVAIPYRLKGEDNIPITILVFRNEVSLEEFCNMSGLGGTSGWVEV